MSPERGKSKPGKKKVDRRKKAIAKMYEFSQNIGLDDIPQLDNKPKVSRKGKPEKKTSKDQPKISSIFGKKARKADIKEDGVNLDDLLKVPDSVDDLEELLDDFDERITNLQKTHDDVMQVLSKDIDDVKKSKEDFLARQRSNSELRDRLSDEVTEAVVKELFNDNLVYLRKIWKGTAISARHNAFHKGGKSRHGLYYTMITDPFTDEQLKWTLDEISKVGIFSNYRWQNRSGILKCYLSEYRLGLDEKQD